MPSAIVPESSRIDRDRSPRTRTPTLSAEGRGRSGLSVVSAPSAAIDYADRPASEFPANRSHGVGPLTPRNSMAQSFSQTDSNGRIAPATLQQPKATADTTVGTVQSSRLLRVSNTPLYVESSDVESQAMTRDGSGLDDRQSSDLSEPPTDIEDHIAGVDKAESAKKKFKRRAGQLDRSDGPMDTTALMASKKRPASEGHRGGDRSKKIKISSPSKQRPGSAVDLGILPGDAKQKPKGDAEARTRPRDDDQNSNDEHCSACRGTGKLLCCDDCPRSFHFSCIEPPIEEADIPDEPYFCMSCWEKRYGFPEPPPGVFHQLLKIELTKDPSMFLLPSKIRSFFDNVSTGDAGEYVESKEQKPLRKDRHGFAEEVDPLRLRDRQNNPVLCYRCGGSAMNSAGMSSCDHCSAHWHFDCLDPPLSGPPLATKKWMCPLHAHDLTPTARIPRQPKIVDVSLRRGFINNGDIDVELEQETEDQSEAELDDADDNASAGSAGSSPPARLPKIKYRLPQSGIALDFLDTCRRSREKEGIQVLDVLESSTAVSDPRGLMAALVDAVMDEQASLNFAEEERVQLLALKALMAVKGKDQLVKFLTN